MKEKTGWVILGANSVIAKELIKLLSKNKGDEIFCISRKQKSKSKSNIHYLDNKNYLNTVREFRGINLNVLMFNGRVFYKKFNEATEKDLRDTIDSNFYASTLFLISLFKHSLNIKKIVEIGTRAGLKTDHKYFSLYAATKTANLALLRSLSAEYTDILFTYFIGGSVKTNIFARGIVSKELIKGKPKNKFAIPPQEFAKEIFEYTVTQKKNSKDLIYTSRL